MLPAMDARRAPLHRERPSFFGPLPATGIWTAAELTRGQFLCIVTISVLLFLFIDGPLWQHMRDSHLARIGWSYAAIGIAVVAFLWRNRKLDLSRVIVATLLVSLAKLVITALLLIAIGVAR